jgi:glycosyltransferase involved in cell wall biosynthesis
VKILFVGGDFKRKGGATLLDAFRRLRSELTPNLPRQPDPPVELHLVTRDPIPEERGVYVYNHMQPNSAELKRLYFNSHIFCLPTSGDCLPMALSEAGAAGLPLVSTRLAAIPEIVRDGETGFLVPAEDAAALAMALQRLIDGYELRLRLGEAAARLAGQCYDARKNTARLLRMLKELADEGSGDRKVL